MRILIVDDDVNNRNLLGEMLKDFGDCTFVADGVEAFTAYKRAVFSGFPYHFMTLDIEMPNMDGHETLAAIRDFEQDQNIDSIVVFMISACDDDANLEKSFSEACTAYLVKPVDPDSLISTMKRMGIIDREEGDAGPCGPFSPEFI